MRDKSSLQEKLLELKAEHKRLKSEVATKKLLANGTFGKLGSPYCAFYSPDLLLAVTVTGQLLLACLIHDLEKIKGVSVVSANTDGILVRYPKVDRSAFIGTIRDTAMRTGLEFEETPYSAIAMKDVNSYINITEGRNAVIVSPDGTVAENPYKGGKAKRKGLYSEAGLMKNPSTQVCSNLATDYLKHGILPRDGIANYTDIKDYVEIRNVKGGGVRFGQFVEVDDWVLIDDKGTKDNAWFRQAWFDDGLTPDFDSGPGTGVPANSKKPVFRKSRPPAVKVGEGAHHFGRLARWYMSNADDATALHYAGSGNKVPGTDGSKLCLTLPDALPDDIDYEWYIKEAERILDDLGVLL